MCADLNYHGNNIADVNESIIMTSPKLVKKTSNEFPFRDARYYLLWSSILFS